MLICVKKPAGHKDIHLKAGCLRNYINVVCYEMKLSLNNYFGANVNDPIQFVEVFIF
jgi:hypothetical protein